MKKEIKFRAWHIELKRWINLNGFDIAFKGCNNEGEVYEIYEQGNLNTFAKEDVQLMQFTGLKDKNGVEIYEGDVLDLFNSKIQIEFFTGAFGYWVNKGESMGYFISLNSNSNIEISHSYICKYQIIGNIHENPELL